jgi:acetate kinase
LCKHFFNVPISSTFFGREKLVEHFYSRSIQTNHEHFLQAADCTDHKQGLKKVLELLNFGKGHSGIAAVGHRVVHGGETLTEPTIITDSVKRAIEKAIPLAPLHNPPNLQV